MYKRFTLVLIATLCCAVSLSTFAQVVDTQILDKEVVPTEPAVSFQKFNSCEDMNTVLKKYFREALLEQRKTYGNAIKEDMGMWGDRNESQGVGWGSESPSFSGTNIQVEWIDEADVIKTDWKYIYYASNTPEKNGSQYVTIALAGAWKDMAIVKKIQLPTSYSNIQLYLSNSQLTILATKWNQDYIYNSSPLSLWNGSSTVVVVYNVSDVTQPKLERYYTVSGDLSQSRREGDYLYVLSQNWMNTNIWWNDSLYSQSELDNYIDTKFDVEKMLPVGIDIHLTKNSQKEITLKGKKVPYSLEKGRVGCNEVEYILPNTPQALSFVTLSIIPLKWDGSVKRKVIYGDASQFFMTQWSFYIVSNYFSPSSGDSTCPPNARCIIDSFRSHQNSLIHRFSVQGENVAYKYSVMTPGMPLSQYAISEKKWVLYTANQRDWMTNGVDIFAIDQNGKLLSKLENVWEKERFQAARYIDDRLYLVTFEQTDPFFVIDTENPKNMTILWELKIPGYSTYLHPYDATHLIWVGIGSRINPTGGVLDEGIKFDLYDVSDVGNPKQKFTKTIGGIGSTSDALWNPRALVWDSKNHTLLLPAQLMDQNMFTYQSTYAWQGLLAVKIDTNGISEVARISHIDMSGIAEKRKQECTQYTTVIKEEKCYTHITTGEKICVKPADNPINQNIPAYCFAENDDSSYLANQIWNYYPYFIQRGVFIGDTLYTASPSLIQANQYGWGYGFLKKVINWEPQEAKG